MFSSTSITGAQYVAAYQERLLGGKCSIEVVVDLSQMTAQTSLSMESMLSTRPVYTTTLQDLRTFLVAVRNMKDQADLLSSPPEGATGTQLNCTVRGASAVIYPVVGKATRYTLTLGAFNQTGELSELNLQSVEDATRKLEQLEMRTLNRARKAT
jgi:hypothetical protein